MKKKNVAGGSIVLFVIMLSLTTLACGFLTGDDETAGSLTAGESQDTPQEPGSEPAIAEPAAPKEATATEAGQPVKEEESDPVESDEGATENGELSNVIRPTPLEDIQAMHFRVQNLFHPFQGFSNEGGVVRILYSCTMDNAADGPHALGDFLQALL